MTVFIQDADDKLHQIWSKCYVSDYTKELFKAELDTKIDEDSQLSFYHLWLVTSVVELKELIHNDFVQSLVI